MLRIFYKQTHPLALLPRKGYCVLHMLQSALPRVHRLLLLVGLPCPQSHPLSPEPDPPPPSTPLGSAGPCPAPDDFSIASDSCDSDRKMDCDADNVASFEALDEAERIGVDTQDWD